jgi:hypothetical protein
VLKAALLEAGEHGSVDATMQELVNQLSPDLASDGALDPALVAELAGAASALDRYQVKDLLGERLEELGSTAEVPDIDRFFGAPGQAWRFQRVQFPPRQGERAAPPGIEPCAHGGDDMGEA